MDGHATLAMRVRDLRGTPSTWEEEVRRPAEVWPDVGVEFVGPLRFRGVADPVGGGDVHVTGRVETRVRAACRRCLAGLEERLEIPLDLWFRREPLDPGEVGEAVFPLDPETMEVDLVPALREELLLAIPSFPLCRPDCGGLCPGCGARRDEEACDCTFEETDPRWDALRALR